MKITRRQLRQVIKEELRLLEADRDGDGKLSADELRGLAGDLAGGSSKVASAEEGAYVLNGEYVTDPEDPPGVQVQELSKLGVTHVVDNEGDGKKHTLRDWAAIIRQVARNPGLPPSTPLRPSGVESMRAQKMANLDPLADGFDQDFMRLAKAVIELEYSGYGGIIDALIDLGD